MRTSQAAVREAAAVVPIKRSKTRSPYRDFVAVPENVNRLVLRLIQSRSPNGEIGASVIMRHLHEMVNETGLSPEMKRNGPSNAISILVRKGVLEHEGRRSRQYWISRSAEATSLSPDRPDPRPQLIHLREQIVMASEAHERVVALESQLAYLDEEMAQLQTRRDATAAELSEVKHLLAKRDLTIEDVGREIQLIIGPD